MKALALFVAGAFSATTFGLLAVEIWIHLIEHNAYRKGTH
jgi:hypothetical protein